MKYILMIIASFMILACQKHHENDFIRVKDASFYLGDQPYVFMGANYWQGMNIGAPQSGDQKRLIRELDQLQEIGVTNLRLIAASEADSSMKFAIHPALQTAPGIYNDDLWQGLDFLLTEMSKRNMKAVMVLGNFWTWSGGFPQYLKWCNQGEVPYPQKGENTWEQFTDYATQFYFNAEAQDMMNNHIRNVIHRKNSISGTIYKNDPTIMAWQLANEPRGYKEPHAYREWTQRTSAFIKQLDKNHLVCLGTEGNTSGKTAGINVLLDNDNPNIDYITMHIWAQNWGWFKPSDGERRFNETLKKVDQYWNDHVEAAHRLNKPIVLEEFGIARDNSSYSLNAPTVWRNKYFDYLFNKIASSIENNEPVKGFNFWSYSGEGRPPRPGQFWQKGDALLGDPPHERQGWYGVYNTDTTTLDVIKAYRNRIK